MKRRFAALMLAVTMAVPNMGIGLTWAQEPAEIGDEATSGEALTVKDFTYEDGVTTFSVEDEETSQGAVNAYATGTAYAVEGGNIYYDSTGTITGCDDTVTKAVIPEEIGGVKITAIEMNAFMFCRNLTSVIIPEGVTTIRDDAFYGCSSLTSVTIPDSVTGIGEYAFGYCKSLTDIVIPRGVTTIGSWTFLCCDALTRVELPEGITEIGNFAFDGCSGLVALTLPDTVASIGYGVFSNCTKLDTLNVSAGNPYYMVEEGALYSKDGTRLLWCRALTEGDYVIRDGVEIIDSYAFNGCNSITSITISSDVCNIEAHAFWGCESLKEFIVDSNNSSYATRDGVLFACDSLDNIYLLVSYPGGREGTYTVPEDVYRIETGAFGLCSKLTGIDLGNVWDLGDYHTFCGCDGLTEITFPGSITSIPSYVLESCINLKTVTISEGTTYIGDMAFMDCFSLESVVLPLSLTEIDFDVFDNEINGTPLLKDIYYAGSEEDWKKVSKILNDFEGITIHYSYSGESVPGGVGDDTDVTEDPEPGIIYNQPIDSFSSVALTEIFPKEEESIVYGDGVAHRYYTLKDDKGNVLANTGLQLQINSFEKKRYYTNDKGELKLSLYKSLGEGTKSISLYNTDGTLRMGDTLPPDFNLKIMAAVGSNTHKLSAGLSGKLGVGLGASFDVGVGKVEAKLIEAALNGTATRSLGVEYKGDDLILTNLVSGELGTDGSIGPSIGASISDQKLANAKISISGELNYGIKDGYEVTFENYFNNTGEDYYERGLYAFIVTLDTLKPKDVVLNTLLNRCVNIMKEGYTGVSALYAIDASLKGDSSIKIDSIVPLDLKAFGEENEAIYSWTGTRRLEDGGECNVDSSFTSVTSSTLVDVIGSVSYEDVDTGVEKPLLSIEKTDEITKGVRSDFHYDLTKGGYVTDDVKLYLETRSPEDNGLNYTFYNDYTRYARTEFDVKDEHIDAISESVPKFAGLIDGDLQKAITAGEFDTALCKLAEVDNAIGYAMHDVEKNTNSVNMDFSLGAGVSVGLGFSLINEAAYEYQCEEGVVANGKDYIITENDSPARDNRGCFDYIPIACEAVKHYLGEAIVTAWNDTTEAVSNGFATLVRADREFKMWLTRVTIDSVNSVIAYSDDNTISTVEVIGDAYLVQVTDLNDNPVESFAEAPISLEIGYTDDMLGDVAEESLGIYYFDENRGCYMPVEAKADYEANVLTAQITHGGQYLLAVDNGAPDISNFKYYSDGKNVVITANIRESFSGVDADSIVLTLDDVTIVPAGSGAEFYDMQTEQFSYTLPVSVLKNKSIFTLAASDRLGNASEIMILEFTDAVETFLYGDANYDNILGAQDAVHILQKVLDNSFITALEKNGGDAEVYLDTSGDGVIGAQDAAITLQKVLDNSYLMPCEK